MTLIAATIERVRRAAPMGWSVLDQASVSGASFLAAVAVGRFSGTAELGRYTLGVSLIALAVAAQDAALSTSYTAAAAQLDRDDRRRYAGSVQLQSLVLSGVGAALLLAVAGFGFASGERWLAWWGLSLAALLPASLARQLGRKTAFAHGNFCRATAVDVLCGGGLLAGVSTLAAFGQLTASSAFCASAIAFSLSLPMRALDAAERPIFVLRTWRSDLRRTFAQGRWMLASRGVSVANRYASFWLLAMVGSTSAAGLYAGCVTIASTTNVLFFGISNALEPRMARALREGGARDVAKVQRRATSLMWALCLPLIAAAALFGDEALQFLYGHEAYREQTWTLVTLVLATTAEVLSFGSGHGLRILDRAKSNLRANLAAGGVAIVVAASLIPILGPLGAAIATATGASLASSIRYFAFRAAIRETA